MTALVKWEGALADDQRGLLWTDATGGQWYWREEVGSWSLLNGIQSAVIWREVPANHGPFTSDGEPYRGPNMPVRCGNPLHGGEHARRSSCWTPIEELT